MAGPGEMDFQNLADIHSGWYAQWVQYQIYRTAVRGEGHIFDRKDSGAYALITVAAGHFVAFTDFSLLCDSDADHTVHAGSQFILAAIEFPYAYHFAEFTMRHAQGCIADFSFLVAENGAEETFFRGQFGFTLRGDFADQDVPRSYVGTRTNDTVFIQVFLGIFGNGRQFTGDFFRSQFGIAGIAVIFFNMNGSIQVIFTETFGNQDGVFVVVPFPGYESNEYVMAEGQFALIGAHAVSQSVSRFYTVAFIYDRTLVDAGGGVGTFEFDDVIGVKLTIVCTDGNLLAGDAFNDTAPSGKNADAGVLTGYPFHTGSDERSFRTEERHSLALHVGTHEGTVRIIVFKEWNEGCTNGNDLFWRYVHEVYFFRFCFEHISTAAAGHVLMNEMTFRIQRFGCLGNDLVFFDIRSDVLAFISNGMGFLIDQAVRGLDKAVLIDDTVVGQGGNQADVRTFRGFYRAHASIMRVMNVTDFEPCAFTGKAAGAEGGQTALMSQFSQRVCLVHELGQLGGTEEFLDGCRYRTDIDEGLGSHLVLVGSGHSFTNHSFHTGQADTELILQQFTYAADTAVSKMIDIIALAITLHHVQQVIDAGNDIAPFKDTIIIFTIAGGADDFDRSAVIFLGHHFYLVKRGEYAAFFNLTDGFIIDDGIPFDDDFTGFLIDDRSFGLMAAETVLPGQFLIQFIAANLRQIVAAGIIEEIIQECGTTFFGSRFARTELVVDFDESGLSVRCIIFLQGFFNVDIMIEKFKNFIIGRISESADQDSDRHLAVAVDADGNGAGRIRFQFDPGTAVRNQLRAVNFLVESIFFLLVVHARGADQLGYDDTFGAIDDECTGIGHNREIAHVFVMLLQFAGFLVFQAYLYCERRRIVDVFLLALFNVVIRLPEGIIAKVKRPFVCTVFNWGNICKNVFQPFPAEPFVGFRLQIEQMRHFQNFL